MPSPKPRYRVNVGRNLALAASIARRFLDLSPEERKAALDGAEWLHGRNSWLLAQGICEAKELVRLLEDAEQAWIEALREIMNENLNPRPN